MTDFAQPLIPDDRPPVTPRVSQINRLLDDAARVAQLEAENKALSARLELLEAQLELVLALNDRLLGES